MTNKGVTDYYARKAMAMSVEDEKNRYYQTIYDKEPVKHVCNLEVVSLWCFI